MRTQIVLSCISALLIACSGDGKQPVEPQPVERPDPSAGSAEPAPAPAPEPESGSAGSGSATSEIPIDPPVGSASPPPPKVAVKPSASDIERFMASSANQKALVKCQTDVKKKTPRATTSGKLQVSFTIEEDGTTSDHSASGVSPEIEACVVGVMKKWKFDKPTDADGEVTTAKLSLALVLSKP